MGANAMTNFDNAGAASMDLLHMFALTALAQGWAMTAKVAIEKKAAAGGDAFYENKLLTGRFFLERILPDRKANLAKLKTGAGALMALPAEAF